MNATISENEALVKQIELLKRQLEPRGLKDFATFSAITSLSTKQINDVFNDLHGDNKALRAMLSSVVDLQRENYGDATGTHLAMIGKSAEIKDIL
jgi:hypothetical protein